MLSSMRHHPKEAARALSRRCWDAANHNDLAELRALATDPSLTVEMLATIAPGYQDQDSDVELVNRVLDHPACNGAVAGRYAIHVDSAIRLRVVVFPGLNGSALEMLRGDCDERVRSAAADRLAVRRELQP
jgi:hypothetical protein